MLFQVAKIAIKYRTELPTQYAHEGQIQNSTKYDTRYGIIIKYFPHHEACPRCFHHSGGHREVKTGIHPH